MGQSQPKRDRITLNEETVPTRVREFETMWQAAQKDGDFKVPVGGVMENTRREERRP